MVDRYLEKAWYFGGWSNQLAAGEVKELRVTERDLALYRSEAGVAAVIGNRCPHRFAPLHMGKVKGEALECGYHGVQFDARGACAFNPHIKGGKSGSVTVPAYPVVERDGAIWLWLSQDVAPDESLIPDMSFLSTLPDTAKAPVATMEVAAGYEILVDNLLDPTHAEFLHAGVLGGNGILLTATPTMRADGYMIEHKWTFPGVVAVPVLRSYLPDVEEVDTWLISRWYAPGVVVVEAGIKPAGAPEEESRYHAIYHVCMPAGHNMTTYDVMTSRNFARDDVELTEKTLSSLGFAFLHQDKPIMEAQQRMMGDTDFWELKPALFPSDGPSVRVRRALQAWANESKAEVA